MLPLIERLLKALESEGVVYCHWKSNAFIACAAHGEDDLDLLVGQGSRQAFWGILNRLGFKEALTSKGMLQIPGILDYYGYDDTAGRLVHVHVHYKLILGHDMTKNYHLPIENVYLESSFPGEFFRIPAPEFEWTIFVIRMMLKHSTWNAILCGEGKLCSRERQEMEYLQGKVSREQIGHVLAKHIPFLKLELFDDCIRSLQPRCPLWFRFQVGYQVQKALHACRLRPRAIDIWLQFWRRLIMAAKRRLFGFVPRMRMKNGGVLVAFVGGDGAGKTTVVEGIAKWLSPPFFMKQVHMGKPPWSFRTIFIRGILKIGRILRLYPFSKAPVDFRDEVSPAVFPGYPTLIREVCTARDRYLSYAKARRHADKGALVICDRFPLPQWIFMDGPQIEWMARSMPKKGFVALLDKLERKYYQSIRLPDLLFVLKADPDMAVKRKSEENTAFVRARSKEIWEKDWGGTAAHLIDANRPSREVLDKTKAVLWAHF